MNESIRTLTFLGAAAVVGLVAWVTRPAPAPRSTAGETDVVKPFDVADAASLTIKRYDAEEGKLEKFEVAKEAGRWIIPSHDGYPADADAQLTKVAGLFTGMKAVGAQASDDPKQHGDFGVKEPDENSSGDGKEFGRVVTITDTDGKELVNLIVGKSAAATDGGESASAKSYRFVRKVGYDPVYVVDISLDAITTKFEDWIERDLLKLDSFNVAKLDLHDYSLVPVQDPDTGGVALSLVRRMDTEVKWNADSSAWDLEKMTRYQGSQAVEGGLADDEELNKAKLDGVKTAVDDLKIVDVDRKPKVLFDALKDEKLAKDRQARAELQQYGFFVTSEPGTNKLKVFATNGGLSVSMKDGVKYDLYFGDPKSAEKDDSSKLNRYLMVIAQVDESMIPLPMLEPEDEEPVGPESGEKPEDAKPEEEEEEPADEKADDADETKKDDEKKAEDAPEDDQKKADAAKKKRDEVKKRNKQKMDERNDKLKKAQARVAELNARFNDWFYVVSDDVYKKVQLGRADIVKDRDTAKDEGFGVDAFRKLEQGGVEGKAPAANTPPAPPRGLPSGFGM
jgi:hypothetical protein